MKDKEPIGRTREVIHGVVELFDNKCKELDNSFDDPIPMGTPIYSSPIAGQGMVMIPVKKEQQIKYEQKIEKLESIIKHLEDLYAKISQERNEYKRNLKWSYRRKMKKSEKLQEDLDDLEEYEE